MMRHLSVSVALAACAIAQTALCQNSTVQGSNWRSNLSALPATPPPNTSAQDIQQFEKNMRIAATYLAAQNSTPNPNTPQWEANRDLVRRMAAYLYGLQALSRNPKLKGQVTHAQQSFNSLGFAPYLAFAMMTPDPAQTGDGNPPLPPQDSRPVQPPFSLNAPDSLNVADADKDTAAELRNRYETDAATSAAVWGNAETIRQNLELRGMGLNTETATAMARLPQQYRSAAASIRNSDWDGARTHLEQAEAITGKIAKTVGR